MFESSTSVTGAFWKMFSFTGPDDKGVLGKWATSHYLKPLGEMVGDQKVDILTSGTPVYMCVSYLNPAVSSYIIQSRIAG
jgi:hypothetical protein